MSHNNCAFSLPCTNISIDMISKTSLDIVYFQAVFSEKPVSQAPSGTLRCYEKYLMTNEYPSLFPL